MSHRLETAVARFRRDGETSVDTAVRIAEEAGQLADILRSESGSPSEDAARLLEDLACDAALAMRLATRIAARLPEPPESDVWLAFGPEGGSVSRRREAERSGP